MKVFLVGGFGFIGKRFIRKFTDSHEITVYATKQDIQNANKVLDLEKISVEEGLVEEQKLGEIVKKHNPDVVVHLAALTGLVKCHNNPDNAFKINVYGTHNVVNACIRASCKLIFISSREVYGETINDSSKEDDPMLPNNVYGLTKKIGEHLVELASQKNGILFNYSFTPKKPRILISKVTKQVSRWFYGKSSPSKSVEKAFCCTSFCIDEYQD